MRVLHSRTGLADSTGPAPSAQPAQENQPNPVLKKGAGTIQFGQPTSLAEAEKACTGARNDALKELASLLAGLMKKAAEIQSTAETGEAPQSAESGNVGQSSATSPVADTGQTQASGSEATPVSPGSDAAFLDNSTYSSPEELKKYDSLVSNLPPEQREQAAKEMNRPIAAAKMAAAGGAEGEQARAFIDANPALKTAIDVGKHGGKPDGKTTNGDYKSFAKNMEKARDAASKDVDNYKKENPNADPQSLQMVMSAAALRASEPLAKAGALNQDGKVDKYITADALKGLQENNPGLASSLTQSAKTFSQPGLMTMLDQGGFEGKSLALHNPDQKISTHNIDDWIKKQAPTNGGEFSSMMSDAATRNAVASVDISQLNEDVFNNPQNYSGAQKAAVMVKLQQTLEQVNGGSSLRKVDKTSAALEEKIGQLQQDQGVKDYLNKAVPAQEKNIINSDPALTQAVSQRYEDLKSGKALGEDMQAARDKADKANKGKKEEEKQPADYSSAIGNLDAELKMQGDLKGEAVKVPTTQEVVNSQPELKQEIERSYNENFTQGKAVESGLKNNKKTDATEVLSDVDRQKAAYEAAIPESVTTAAQDGYAEATLKALTTTGKGMSVLKDLKEAGTLPKESDLQKMTGKEMLSQLRDNVEKQTSAAGLSTSGKSVVAGGGALGVAGMISLSDQLKSGDKAAAAKTIYDGVKGASELGKLGYNAVANALAKDASAGLGRMAGAVAGRVVGMVAGEAAGLAAAGALGAAAGPVGWAIDAVMAIGFGIKAIIDAVQKHKDQKTFDHNVDPTLTQFGIPKAH
ncbi:type III effector HrpK domain-containing protein [Erwinia sp. MMLR14_017]|uniref:type III effector HrpK domain-containing protein n=1 Tax=Erwinia sp. MMLR14_017 TaxID=3093842 RepID=UPI00298FA53C|nr:type III effector HrpK domain-containing protein [Erwinia sp. MMLR14_017]MDW8845138.1 type III effector HrpK domain-containing protein [Erwinia sp. MMLR14_017]